MPRPRKGARFGNSGAHEKMILANLTRSLVMEGSVITTVAKAKAMRPFAEKMITKARKGDLHSRRVVLKTMRDNMVGDAATALWVVLGTVGFLLLVACASVANLFLVRAEGRHQVPVDGVTVAAARARTPAVAVRREPVVEIAANCRRAGGEHLAVHRARVEALQLPYDLALGGTKDRLAAALSVEAAPEIDARLPSAVCALPDRPFTLSASIWHSHHSR